MSQDISRTDVDPSPSGHPPNAGGQLRLILCLVLLGVVTYAGSLAASAPARFAFRQVQLPRSVVDVSGTVWDGRAIVAGGYEANWKFTLWQSLFHFSWDVDWSLRGADTQLSGHASLWPRSAKISAVEGRAGWGLVRMLVPGLGLSCDGVVAVSLTRVLVSEAVQGAEGTLRSGDTTCRDDTATPPITLPLPALEATLAIEGARSTARVTTAAETGLVLAEAAVEARVLAVTVHPAAARLVPTLSASGPITLEFPF